MKKATNRGSISDKRMLTMEEACTYTGMGRSSCRQWCEEIGAVRRFGKMVRLDKEVIDRVYDAMDLESRKESSDSSDYSSKSAAEVVKRMCNDPDIQALCFIKKEMNPTRFSLFMRLINEMYELEWDRSFNK